MIRLIALAEYQACGNFLTSRIRLDSDNQGLPVLIFVRHSLTGLLQQDLIDMYVKHRVETKAISDSKVMHLL